MLEAVVPVASASSMPRLTILGVAPIAQPVPRARISMPALTNLAVPMAPAAEPTDLMRRPVARGWWQQFTSAFRGWYQRWAWARRRRAVLRG